MKGWAVVSLLSLAVTTTFGTMIVAPAVKLLAVAFPETNALLIQWVVTLSSIFILPTLFLAGPLARRFSRKSILVAGLLMYLVGGIGPAFLDSFPVILGFRALLGLGIGLISPTFNTLIAENFQGGARTKMMGYITAVNGIGGALFLSVGGVIASFGWRAVFLTYTYAFLLLLLVALFLPAFPPARPTAERDRSASRLPLFFYAVILAGGLHTMLYMLVPARLSLYVTGNGIGDVASVGYLTALSLIGVFVAGSVAGPFFRRLGSQVVPFMLAVMAAGFLLLSLAHGVAVAAAAVFLIGFAEGGLYPLTFAKTADVVPKTAMATGISLLLACIYIFQFVSPAFLQGLQAVFRLSSDRAVFGWIAGALTVIAAGYGLFAYVRKRQTLAGAGERA